MTISLIAAHWDRIRSMLSTSQTVYPVYVEHHSLADVHDSQCIDQSTTTTI